MYVGYNRALRCDIIAVVRNKEKKKQKESDEKE